MTLETRQVRRYDTSLCSLPVNTTPNPQFVESTAKCDQEPPRTVSTRSARKQDVNPDSTTYLQWLKADGTYSVNQADGAYFSFDTDAGACPLPEPKLLRLDADISPGGNLRILVTRQDAPSTPVTLNFQVAKIQSGSSVVAGSDSITISSNGYTATKLITSVLIENGYLYVIRNITRSDTAYPPLGNVNVSGTPT